MNKILKLGLGLLFLLLPFASVSSDIKLEYGVNLIDFNGDGIPDVVVKSRRSFDDSTSVDMTTVYIKGSDQKVYIVPSIYANALSLFNNKIKGTNITISDFKFIEKKTHIILLSAEKIGNNLQKPTPVRFSSHSISENKKSDETQFKWQFNTYCVTESAYLSVEDAYSDNCINKIINE
ncbi:MULTISPECIES: carbapenem self-resistance protein CarG family protein [Proteus]|uniref:carbapenem self-resistance protein CarG family protein n=1 Tax=Proteus TaxID=583 RepID=UPI000197DDEB|nr:MULTISPECIES: hypothetical protein [Proteus]EEG83247.1 hypothetical protein PROPEN_04011 [Proteus penneri ATCC 35198]NBM67546.1 hypothetical protein [Proteus sp. G2663]NBM94830.1 hypothetical protein [Proteus sp. G2662]NBN03755.1 hypothetical protein [Proteus sp. G2665]NBN25114.1 hypothetical protein [Proteus sp. G2657]